MSTMLIALPRAGSAQIIPIKTLPIAQGDQFDIFPSANVGMGGVSIALADTLLDPFVNPARGVAVRTSRLLSAPTLYGISDNAGGGRTLPLGILAGTGPWFGGMALALQQIDASKTPNSGTFFPQVQWVVTNMPRPVSTPATPSSYGNQYAFALVGRKLPDAGLALGASASWARLTGVDGVDLLYAGSSAIHQFGHALDLRVGLFKEWPGARTLEALALHNRFRMTHDVTYLDEIWDPAAQQFTLRPRVVHDADETNAWGLHVGYTQPIGAGGWRLGGMLTANRLSHPELPAYQLANVPVLPWDPGRSSAFNAGIGVSKTDGPTTFGLDVIYEPIWSYTWADAPAPATTLVGDTIPTGGKTVENHFHFSNAVLRLGTSRSLELGPLGKAAELQLGLALRSVHYHLAQADHVLLTNQALDEGWIEWTPTWGLALRFPDLEIRYRGRVTKGTGRPGVQSSGRFFAAASGAALVAGSILAAPSGPLTLQEVSTTTHQVSIAVPLW
ncbi:MAG TPA: hypothetical protein VM736_12520 [Gemmatimonadales bacterium]|nr:hypothetical protein [Gemmatimonadales bacterium]